MLLWRKKTLRFTPFLYKGWTGCLWRMEFREEMGGWRSEGKNYLYAVNKLFCIKLRALYIIVHPANYFFISTYIHNIFVGGNKYRVSKPGELWQLWRICPWSGRRVLLGARCRGGFFNYSGHWESWLGSFGSGFSGWYV